MTPERIFDSVIGELARDIDNPVHVCHGYGSFHAWLGADKVPLKVPLNVLVWSCPEHPERRQYGGEPRKALC